MKSLKTIAKYMDGGLKNIGAGTVASFGLNAAFTLGDYSESRKEGNGVLTSAAKAVGTNLMFDIMGAPLFLGYQALTSLPKAGVDVYEKMAMEARQLVQLNGNVPFKNSTFVDSNQNYTMRQAGMNLAKASKYNMQCAMLGNEAEYMRL